MHITSDTMLPNLIYSTPYHYTDDKKTFDLTLYPITMANVLEFSIYKHSILVRKNSIFPVKSILKMTYMEFLFYAYENSDLSNEYNMPLLPIYYIFAFELFRLVFKDQTVEIKTNEGGFRINGVEIDDEKFDNIRRIIILQNGIDFDIDEFIHYDTEKELQKAQYHLTKNEDTPSLEDYIDSICVALHYREDEVKNMTIRKFFRYIKRINKLDMFKAYKAAESSGMVKFKQPIQYWMNSIDKKDKYSDVKTDTDTIRKMIK